MQIMQNKKGPSWKDADTLLMTNSKASTSASKVSRPEPVAEKEEAIDAPADETTSDLDWLKRRMKLSLDISQPVEKDFAQSDEEMAEPSEVRPPSR